jgi:hypothetical protein
VTVLDMHLDWKKTTKKKKKQILNCRKKKVGRIDHAEE